MTFFLVAIIGTIGIHLIAAQREAATDRTIAALVASVSTAAERRLSQPIDAAIDLANEFRGHGSTLDSFEHIVTDGHHHHPLAEAVMLAEGGVVSVVSNRGMQEITVVQGHDWMADGRVGAAPAQAKSTGRTGIAGPFDWVPGVPVIAVFEPIAVRLPESSPDAKPRFWGFAVAVARVDELLPQAELRNLGALGFDFEIRRSDAAGTRFAGSVGELPAAEFGATIELPGGDWKLAVARRATGDGWMGRLVELALVLVAALGAAGAVYGDRRSRESLALAMSKQSATLLAMRETLDRDRPVETGNASESRPDGRPDGRTDSRAELRRALSDLRRENMQLDEARQFLRGVLDALNDHIAILDSDGNIALVNAAWIAFGNANGLHDAASCVGKNYLDVCDASIGDDAAVAREVATAIGEIARGERDFFTCEYPCHSPTEERWFAVRIAPFDFHSARWMAVTHETITARRAAEIELRQSEERFRRAFDDSAVPMALVAADGSLRRVNRALGDILGYGVDELVAMTVLQLIHPDERPAVEINFARLMRGEIGSVTTERRLQHKAGATIWAVSTATAVRDGNGDPAECLWQAQNITSRVEATEELQRSQARLTMLFEQLPVAMWSVNADFTIEWVGGGALGIFDFTPESLRGLSTADVLGTMDAAPALSALQDAALAGQSQSTTLEFRGRWFDMHLTPQRDESDAVVGIVGLALDISDRVTSEAAVAESRERLRILIDNLRDAVFSIEWPSLRVVEISRACEDIFGVPPESFFTEPERLAASIHPDDRERVTAEMAGLDRGTYLACEFRILRPDREWRWVEARMHPTRDAARATVRVDGVISDITARKSMETVLENERASLARRVEERTMALATANAELARAARLKDEFIAGVSHELRTPLNAILGMSEVLREQIYGPLNDKQIRSIAIVEESGRHLLELINDILDMSKIGAGKLELEMTPLSIKHVCEACLRLVKQDAHRKRLAVSSNISDDVMTVVADERRLKQILVNLLSNAVKFTPDGGKIGLDVRLDAERHIIEFGVWDTGIGIADDDLQRLFKPFTQLDARLNRNYEGTGLGLALVASLTDLHGGGVHVESQVGKGSRFTVTLPAPPSESHPTHAALSDSGAIFKPLVGRALLFEESSAGASPLAQMIGETGLDVTARAAPADALDAAFKTRPDLIVIDLLLPKTTWWEFLAHLKAREETRHIPVVSVSAIENPPELFAAGITVQITKPVNPAILHATLANLTGQSADATAAFDLATLKPHVLLVEDNESTIDTVCDFLAAKGFAVSVARNGRDGVQRAIAERPTIILMDIQMPEMDGLEAIRHIRANAATAKTPIIAVTAFAMRGDRERCFEAGANDYLSKPVSLRLLVRRMLKLIFADK